MMEKDKEKTGTVGRLVVRVGGFVLALPIAVYFSFILLVCAIGITFAMFFGFPPAGVSPILNPIFMLLDVLCLLSLFILVRATIRYTGGIRALFRRLRGIQDEQARIERLMQTDSSQVSDDSENMLYFDEEDSQQAKKQ